MATAAASTGIAITNPLVKYRALLATKQLLPDESQFRLAIHLQKLYDRLKDYEPEIEYSARLDQISRAARLQQANNGTFNDAISSLPSRWRSFMAAKQTRDSLALTRRLMSHESAMQLTSPKGFMLHGEVGTGKSMLIDLFADCLPTRKKRRWHFNTFMLETFSKLEALRRSRSLASAAAPGSEDDYSLLWLAKDMVQNSPVLFLDEFQLPDRAASKILTNLMTSFFHLGGVLIATSNRMPEELAKAAGEDFPLPAPSRLGAFGREFWSRRKSRSDALFGGQDEMSIFLEVLKARCEVWEMRGERDYRRLESGSVGKARVAEEEVEKWLVDGHDDLQRLAEMPVVSEVDGESEMPEPVAMPKYFSLDGTDDAEGGLAAAIEQATGQAHLDGVPWQASSLRVYGRPTPIPRICNGVTMWTFDELCKSVLGPADYISIASLSHTVILTDVPVLTWLAKNEARRFITLLDALYECRCKLYISAEAGPDDLFFPENATGKEGEEAGDAVYSETISDVYQDATAPFRPNILSQNPNYVEPDPEPDYTHARLAGKLAADALEDDPPNKPSRRDGAFGRSFGRTDGEMDRRPVDPDEERYTAAATQRRKLDFGNTSRFTGEDERFAYKRAQSRLWEMCGARWWARDEPGWHRPLPEEARRWERLVADEGVGARRPLGGGSDYVDAGMGEAAPDETRDKRSFKTGASSSSSPFRNSEEPPPKISWTHVWGTTIWGPKAGKWGQGVEGLKEKVKDGKE